ncbi:MAG: hypothetical protein ACLFOY_13590 [Desulfatibacillaceae bacterium]
MEKTSLDREQALAALEAHGITGRMVYLVDVLPLVEMMWADGVAQEKEVAILERFLNRHVERVNAKLGNDPLTPEEVRGFLLRFLVDRPDPELLRGLRRLVAPARLSDMGALSRQMYAKSLLAACMDIASASSALSDPGLHDRFEIGEKLCFFELMESFS